MRLPPVPAYGDRIFVEMTCVGNDGRSIFVKPRSLSPGAHVTITVDLEFVVPFYGSSQITEMFNGIHRDIHNLREEVKTFNMSDQDALKQINDKLTEVEAAQAAAKDATARLIADVETLLAKVTGGGSISAADLQAVLDRETAIANTATQIAADSAAEAAKAEAPAV